MNKRKEIYSIGIIYKLHKNLLITILLEAKASDLIDDVDFDDNDEETGNRNIDIHDKYDSNDELNSNENNMNYESDYRQSASVAQLVKERVIQNNQFYFITSSCLGCIPEFL